MLALTQPVENFLVCQARRQAYNIYKLTKWCKTFCLRDRQVSEQLHEVSFDYPLASDKWGIACGLCHWPDARQKLFHVKMSSFVLCATYIHTYVRRRLDDHQNDLHAFIHEYGSSLARAFGAAVPLHTFIQFWSCNARADWLRDRFRSAYRYVNTDRI